VTFSEKQYTVEREELWAKLTVTELASPIHPETNVFD